MSAVNQYFKDYPNSSECFQTSDGFLFHFLNDARNHANTLADKQVVNHKRETDGKESASAVVDYSKMKLEELKALCAEAGIDASGFKSKKECIEALDSLKSKNQDDVEDEQ